MNIHANGTAPVARAGLSVPGRSVYDEFHMYIVFFLVCMCYLCILN